MIQIKMINNLMMLFSQVQNDLNFKQCHQLKLDYLFIRRIIHLYTISTFPDDDGFGNRNINQNDDSNFRPLDFPSEPDNFVVTDDDQNYRYR